MDCPNCNQHFDQRDRRPKVLTCGHTVCLTCLRQRKRTCPLCEKKIMKPPDQLPDNVSLQEVLFVGITPGVNPPELRDQQLQTDPEEPEEQEDRKRKMEDVKPDVDRKVMRFYCVECDNDAEEMCVDVHIVQSLKSVRAKRCGLARVQLEELTSGENALNTFLAILENARRDMEAELSSCHSLLDEQKALLCEAKDRLEAALLTKEWEEEAKKVAVAANEGLSRDASMLLADLSRLSPRCSLTIGPGPAPGPGLVVAGGSSGADSSGPSWRGLLRPDEDPLVRLLLCRMLCKGALQREVVVVDLEGAAKKQAEKQASSDGKDPKGGSKDASQEEGKVGEEGTEKVAEKSGDGPEQKTTETSDGGPQQKGAEKVLSVEGKVGEGQQEEKKTEEAVVVEEEEDVGSEEETDDEEEEVSLDQSVDGVHTWDDRTNDLLSPTCEDMARRIVVGSRVVPGRDWVGAEGAEGAEGVRRLGRGVVAKLCGGVVAVTWLSAAGARGSYKMGADGQYWLRLLPSSLMNLSRKKAACFVAPDGLDMTTLGDSILKRTTLLTSGQLKQVRSLSKLQCHDSPPWAERVLEQVSPKLENLFVIKPGQRHLRVIRAMPRLRALWLLGEVENLELPDTLEELYFTTVTAEQLLQVSQIASLRRLEVHCLPSCPLVLPPDAAFPRARRPAAGLRWLRTGIYPLRAALALVRAHARSLRELQLVAASDAPYGCPDLPRQLRACGLRRLQRLVLLRESHRAFCRHDDAACRNQLLGLWAVFMETSVMATVLCSICNAKDLCDD